ncbi:MAG: DNA repair protein RadA [Chlamydiae bacterium RIFCSPHIGHO2_12_FULL_44_59]|nr:MAG: DNA repair protein RadA [Chlamydiae bacterium RIFCSPHIGHO2_01_FULL_44_39]OGN58414.1 MAG: DNA repair protein RadA [Chlamydiae bacterium RIFCSPHIGHO2_02_FULL_45_9]OGN59467.1 MAG: DNA repair protein RadA [Chlamydiae bacterium RIFCSPHIGHO2_12_FULL_44_59]OGN67220.1 MAG: DNA repair protein RadA [Chlamydiae bacterium RIFCSPLOWO2_01_FULL_44_52]OGN67417.1 MAG: DNA repair protein RadA [Chlamydiae bacterium RIFCSPLOWO2_02_FULL_45_22]OGN69149.1 MAG: DNA repair protein RadA [Chlamydiae bacterium RI
MKVSWACQECGHTQSRWTGSCPICNKWNTLLEEKIVKEDRRFESKLHQAAKAIPISDVNANEYKRVTTQMGELDRLMGGGLVEGSLTLVGGEPGVGKSTLMLQIASTLASQGLLVLYICGEESAEQTSLRAKRLGINHQNLYLLSETNFTAIKTQIDALNPDIAIVDSIQILYKAELQSAPGSVVQVREIATEFMHLSKGQGITTFLVGHVTKSGELAGPRILEHLVDTVLEFEGDKQHGFRLLRSVKNRFGSTDEIAIFQMKENGLDEVPNPSQAFLEERMKEIAGSAIVPGLEGARSFLLEIQALVTSTAFPNPSRRCAGLDANRLGLLLAVLDKRCGYRLHQCDVFVALAGGLKIVEPAIDLGILLAVASSFMNRAIPSDCIVLGEVGLGGEVRGVSRVETRLKEAVHMGFKKCILPKKNLKGLSNKKMELVGVELVDEAIRHLLS